MALSLERLEDRVALASFTVTSNSDLVTDVGSLRYALTQINASTDASNTITISPSLTGGQTITLTSALPQVAKRVSILGPGASVVTISGGDQYQVFSIATLNVVTISGLTIADGSADSGGGIYNAGSLSLRDCALTGNSASGAGGGIRNDRVLVVSGCTFEGNTADAGGGVSAGGIRTVLSDSTFHGNQAATSGGGIDGAGGSVLVTRCTIAENKAEIGGGISNTGSTPFSVSQSIVALNTAPGTPDAAGAFSSGTNLVGKSDGSVGWTGSDVTGTIASPLSPLLGPLADNGGPTRTMALLAGSPAIDAGFVPSGGERVVDQRGAQRGANGLNAGQATDLGAYEASSSYLVSATGDEASVGRFRSAITWSNASTNANPANLAPNTPAVNTITFDTTVTFALPRTITLGRALPQITRNVSIAGPGSSRVTVSGADRYQVFNIGSNRTVSIVGLTIAGGFAASGGGIYNAGKLTIVGSTIAFNTATSSGGGLYNLNGTVDISGSTISDNEAVNGGGLATTNGTVTVTGTTIASNTANNLGGGIYVAGTLTITGSTVAGNQAGNGGGIARGTGTVRAQRTILAGNAASSNPDALGAVTSLGNNLVGKTNGSSGWTGSDLTGTIASPRDPRLGLLADNGGPTRTMALLTDSPAIDAGGATFGVDQRGALRGTAGLRAGGYADIGAYEASSSYLVSTTADDAGSAGTLRAAIGWGNASTNANPANLAPNTPAINTITFDTAGVFASPRTILPTVFLPTIVGDLHIAGPGASLLAIGGSINGVSSPGVFSIAPDANVSIADITNTGIVNAGSLVLTRATVRQGGIENTGTLEMFDSIVTQGNGVSNDHGHLTVTNSTISDNFGVSGNGGGISNEGGTVIVVGSTITSNRAVRFENPNQPWFLAGAGGGIYNNNGTLIVRDSVVSFNRTAGNDAALHGGGGIFNRSGSVEIINSTLYKNFVSRSYDPDVDPIGSGGGIHNVGGTINITASTIESNSAVWGAGVSSQRGIVNISDSSVVLNSSMNAGGGIFCSDGELNITNSTIAYNSAGTNAAINLSYSSTPSILTVVNSTIAYNTATGGVGGLSNSPFRPSVIRLGNTILAENAGTSSVDVSGPLTSLGHNLIGKIDGSTTWSASDQFGFSHAPLDPRLGPLSYNGGPTRTLALLVDSPALNNGDSSLAPLLDQRGVLRGPAGLGAGSAADIGAFEVGRASQIAPSADTSHVLPFLQEAAPAGGAATLYITSDRALDSSIRAINAVAPPGPLDITIDLDGGTYTTDSPVAAQAGVTVTIVNGTLVGGSPALVVDSGTVILSGITALNATDAPTLLVNGGMLVVRNSTIEESSEYAQAALSITGGAVDLGTAEAPGGNVINVNGAGGPIENPGRAPIAAVGVDFTVDGTPGLPTTSVSGLVFDDFNGDGQVDFGERGIPGVVILLVGVNDLGEAVLFSVLTDENGIYRFADLRPGRYTISETQPDGYTQGRNSVGTRGGTVTLDQFDLVLEAGLDALNYNYGERPPSTGAVRAGQVAGIGFWNNKNGQALILALNGGIGTQLADWLAATLPRTFGAQAGNNNLAGRSNAQVAAYYQERFRLGGSLDAQVLATALSVYATSATLNPEAIGSEYGLTIAGDGLGTATFDVGTGGDAFGVADNTTMTVMDLLIAADAQSVDGVLFGGDAARRKKALKVFGALNQMGSL